MKCPKVLFELRQRYPVERTLEAKVIHFLAVGIDVKLSFKGEADLLNSIIRLAF